MGGLEAIFPHRIKGALSVIYRALNRRRFVRAGDLALRSALVDVFGEITIADVYQHRGISLSVPAVDMATHRAWVFKRTPASGHRDEDYKLVDVCLASSAAPIFRSLAAVEDPIGSVNAPRVFADGGLWANNPVMVALTDALAMAGDSQPVEIFSLGTCPRPEGEHVAGDEVHRSLLDWRSGADVGPLSISAQEFAYDNMAWREKALKCWDKAFNTTFFSERYEAEADSNSAASAPAVRSSALRRSTAVAGAAVTTRGSGRYA